MPVLYVNIKSVRRIIITLVTVVAAVDSVREQILCNLYCLLLLSWCCEDEVVHHM